MADILTRDAILAVDDRRFATVDVPEWGGAVRLASISAAKLLQYHEYAKSEDADHVAFMLSACIVNEKGEPQFTKDDLPRLAEKHPQVVIRLFREASSLNVLTAEAAETQRGN